MRTHHNLFWGQTLKDTPLTSLPCCHSKDVHSLHAIPSHCSVLMKSPLGCLKESSCKGDLESLGNNLPEPPQEYFFLTSLGFFVLCVQKTTLYYTQLCVYSYFPMKKSKIFSLGLCLIIFVFPRVLA